MVSCNPSLNLTVFNQLHPLFFPKFQLVVPYIASLICEKMRVITEKPHPDMTSQFFADANCAKIHINGKYDQQFMQKGLSSLLILYQARTLKDPFDCLLTSLSLMLILSQFGLVTYLHSSFKGCYSSGKVPAYSRITLGHV